MALSPSSIAEVRTGGSDTLNGGLFDPSKVSAGGFTDGAATLATSNAPVFTSASYTFLAGDQNAWLYIDSGTNWTPGWYQITLVSGGAATLSAAIGAAVLASNAGLNTVAGCATTASPTGAKWTIDYSQQTAAQFTYTDLSSTGAGLTASSVGHPIGKQQVGNSIVITGGTNFTAGRYVLATVSGTTGTFVGAANLHTAAGTNSDGAGGMGGAFKTPGQTSAVLTGIGQNKIFLRNDGVTHSITSATNNVANGCISLGSTGGTVYGYATARTVVNTDTPPTLQLNVGTATMLTNGIIINVLCDGNSQASATFASGSTAERCTVQNFTAASVGGTYRRCRATGNTATVFTGASYGCVATSNTGIPFGGGGSFFSRCLSYGNTGASTDGFSLTSGGYAADCGAYGNGRDGFSFGTFRSHAENCHAEGNTGVGFKGQTTTAVCFAKNCSTFGNTGGPTSGNIVQDPTIEALSASPFTNAASGDFSLNNTAGAGASLRASGSLGTFPGGLTTGYADRGAAQHQDPAVAGFTGGIFGG